MTTAGIHSPRAIKGDSAHDNYVLTTVGGVAMWMAPPSAVETLPVTIIDAKGDLIVGTADNTAARKAVGADATSLVADNAAAGGMKWENRVKTVVAGTNVSVDNTDPLNPVVSASGGGGSLTVQDENGNVSTTVTQIDFQGAGVTATAGTGEVIVTIPGGSGSSAFSGCRVRRTTNTTLAAGAWSFFAGWDAELFDTDSYHDNVTNNARLTAPSTGYYFLDCHLAFTAAAAAQIAVGFVLNGATADQTIVRADDYAGFGSAGASGIYLLTAGDYVRVSYYCQSGTPTVTSGTTGAAYASIHRIGT